MKKCPPETRAAGRALVKTWRYKPFEEDGQPVAATFTDYVSVLPPELPLPRDVPFPIVRDWSSLKITLTRTMCYGAPLIT